MQTEADTIHEEKTRLLDQVKIMQKDKIDITRELSNMVSNHVRTEEETLKLNTMASENIISIDEMRKKNDKSMTGEPQSWCLSNWICDMGIAVLNQKQVIAHSSKEHEKCASDVQTEADTIQEERLGC